jgi:RHS repeat-associated protein
VTDYVWDGNTLAMQMDSEEGLRAFVHAPGTFVPVLQQERGDVLAYVVDQVGTPKELLTRDGLVAWSAAHSAWGSVVAEYADPQAKARYGRVVTSPFRLLGQVADEELALCFTRYRLFDAEVGRWVSADPLGITGGRNLYAFDGAPSVVVDALGLASTRASGRAHGTGPNGGARNPSDQERLDEQRRLRNERRERESRAQAGQNESGTGVRAQQEQERMEREAADARAARERSAQEEADRNRTANRSGRERSVGHDDAEEHARVAQGTGGRGARGGQGSRG